MFNQDLYGTSAHILRIYDFEFLEAIFHQPTTNQISI